VRRLRGRGGPYNGVAERFFKTLKEQIIHGRVYRTVAELRAVAAFVDLYNEHVSGYPRRTASSAPRRCAKRGTLRRPPRKEDPCPEIRVRYIRFSRDKGFT
jgi:hypothetical protein